MTDKEKTESNTIRFWTNDTLEIIKLCENGDIFVKGKLIENDIKLVEAMREFLTSQLLISNLTP